MPAREVTITTEEKYWCDWCEAYYEAEEGHGADHHSDSGWQTCYFCPDCGCSYDTEDEAKVCCGSYWQCTVCEVYWNDREEAVDCCADDEDTDVAVVRFDAPEEVKVLISTGSPMLDLISQLKDKE